MFDGNFRSGRRQMNLGSGGSSKRRAAGDGPKSKQALLRTAQIQRQQRQKLQRQNKAAIVVQRWSRGYLSRRHLSTSLEVEWASILQNRSNLDEMRLTRVTATRLSPSTSRFLTPGRVELLCSFAEVVKGATRFSEDGGSFWFSTTRIAIESLKELRPGLLNEPSSFNALISLLQPFFEALPRPACNICLLKNVIAAIQPWWYISFQEGSSSDRTNLIRSTTRTMCEWYQMAAHVYAHKTQASPSQLSSFAVSMLIGTTPDIFHSSRKSVFSEALPSSFQSDDYYTTWFLPLASILESDGESDHAEDTEVVQMLASTRAYLKTKETVVLSNVLDLFQISAQAKSSGATAPSQPKPYALIHLFRHVLEERSDLASMASLIVRGDDLTKLASSSSADDVTTSADNTGDDDSDDESDEEDWELTNQQPKSHKKTRSSSSASVSTSSRYSRQNLLTLVKLDQLYQNDIHQQLRNVVAMLRQNNRPFEMLPLAQKVGSSATMWRQWGMQLFGQQPVSEDARKQADLARSSYMKVLGMLLRFTTSIKHNPKGSSSKFLAELAFHSDYLELLWEHVRSDEASYESLSVFCDIFSHYLIALGDTEFLRQYTTVSMGTLGLFGSRSATSSPKVLAEDIIVRLRDALYELYWNRPVIVPEVRLATGGAGSSPRTGLDDGRGRLILSGTKLWNSLHERWTRLVRQAPFCDESVWWFPRLSTREGTGAVVSHRENRETNSDDDNNALADPMDIDSDDENMDTGLSGIDAETNELSSSFRDPKMARVLTCIPQALPFERRVKLFSSLLAADKLKTQDETASFQQNVQRMIQQLTDDDNDDRSFEIESARPQVQIRRSELYSDSMNQLNRLGPRLKRRVQVSFVNQHGAEEAGIDGGGVFKEFLDDLIKDAFVADVDKEKENAPPRLFSVTPLQTLTVNPSVENYHKHKMLNHYEFLGRVMGKAVYESILVEPQFCLPFLNQLLGKLNSLEDLKNLDEEYYTNLVKLRFLSAADIDGLGMTFELTVGDTSVKGGPRTIELLPGGRNLMVTKQNVIQYIHLVSHYRLNVQAREQTRAFLRGFRDLIPASWVRLFSANELQKVISGDDTVRGIDVDSLERAMQYGSGYHSSQPIIQQFWSILREDLTSEQQRKFLKFMTSCSRQPLLGFNSLEPAPCIQQIRLSDQEQNDRNSRLPSSATCMNLLKLPNYGSRELMRDKLLAAIESGAGFELS